ncbi:MAG: hypothetical protein FWG34_05020 [Oscillospiraceae bacterium]|nr:hypothetical protein [Oscillospiraceae bacterium]
MNNRQDFHTKPDWENISVTSINRIAAHTKWNPFDSAENAKNFENAASPYVSCLNGKYEFKLYGSPDEAKTEEFFLPGFEGFEKKINVPGNWEIQGFGEPIYTNVHMPWNPKLDEACNIYPEKGKHSAPNPPFAPSANPTGCYRHYFDVPENFSGRQIYIRFDGVEAAFYLWVNGKPVGYSEDSKLPCEFDITEFVSEGKNLLALQVIRFPDSIYLEDQDYWYLSGIYRSVWLVAKPKLCIEDYFVKAIPDLLFEGGKFSADVKLSRVDGFADCTVEAYIFDENGDEIGKGENKPMREAQYRTDFAPTANTARIQIEFAKIKLWSPEFPSLYKAVFVLVAPDGKILDVESCEFGFKSIEIKNGVALLNGKRLVIRGVNRHEHCYKTGRTVSVEHMAEEIRQMKRMNINSVRTCHYPDMPEWYELCDKYGILVICECDIETHAVAGMLTHNPEYAPNFVERAVRMVQNHKNHACIYSWSLGNESGTGANHAAMYGYIKEFDSTRLCQYEAGNPGKNISDIRGSMYAQIEQIMHMLTDTSDERPIILVEFLYQICNSGGGMDKFLMLTETYERFQGGYIWDWQDKALEAKDADGNPYFGYGGDFGESMTEYQNPLFMTNNGIAMPDFTWKPVAHEVKQIYAPVYFAKSWRENHYTLKNKFMEKDLSGFKCAAILREDGAVVASGEFVLNALPMSQKEMEISLPHECKKNSEYHLDLDIYDESGNEVSSRQFLLKSKTPFAIGHAAGKTNFTPISLKEDGELYIIAGNDFEYIFSQKTGNISRMAKNGKNYMIDCGDFCFDRPRSGLDAGPNWGFYNEFELTQRENLEKQNYANSFISSDFRVAIVDVCRSFTVKTGETIPCGAQYRIDSDGAVYVSFYVNSTMYAKHLQRAGMEFVLPTGYDKIKYFARGEIENYCDRKFGAKLGVYETDVDGLHFAFSPPSENGGREEARWLVLSNGAGNSVKIEGVRPFHFDARHYTVASCKNAKHDHEIEKRKETILHIDAAHGPIGGNMAWSTVMPHDLALKGGYYAFDFKMTFEK